MSSSRAERRHVHGVLLLDKPSGYSSNAVLQRVKRIFNAHKAGHTGALDPLATGMLPICFGEATKFSQFLLDANKHYRVVAKLGQRTTTSDAEGDIIEQREVHVTRMQLEQALAEFMGESTQVPSMYSALKYQGKPLYEYARKGVVVPREGRKIIIYQLTLIDWQNDEVELEITCSKGTYIRTLIDDLGEKLKCGAHVIELYRSKVANYAETEMISLDMLLVWHEHNMATGQTINYHQLDALLKPLDSMVKHLPEVNVNHEVAERLRHGQIIKKDQIDVGGLVRLTEGDTHLFFGIGHLNEEKQVIPKRLVSQLINADKK